MKRPAAKSWFEERAREKELAREADEQAIASGKKSASEVSQANNHFGRLVRQGLVRRVWSRVRAFS
jgi:hypothetical protein